MSNLAMTNRERCRRWKAQDSKKYPERKVHGHMVQRCTNPNATGYRWYGGRGINVCERWRGSFAAFYTDMGPRPSSKHSIDRVDSNGDYTPDNCRWATAAEQQRNKRSLHKVTYNGESLCLAEWGERTGISRRTIRGRLVSGWSVDGALTEPVSRSRYNRPSPVPVPKQPSTGG